MFKAIASTFGFAIVLFALSSCHPGKKGIFGPKKTAHEEYAERLDKAGLQQTALAKQWLAAAENSLAQPARISLPHKEAGYFAAEEPRAIGLISPARRGATLKASLQIVPALQNSVFMELWKIDTSNNERDFIAQADSTLHIQHEVEDDGLYLLRLQPELLSSMEYTLILTTQPSLAFPVIESGKPVLISFWNDRRDEGRNHQGVDISAPFRTPAISAADGHVRSVTENRLGGKVVFMRPEGKNYTLYYAHLDSQIVSSGQDVKLGDTIGLIGNTGNAINTPPHLHFGIYTRGGAVDPLPFIDNRTVPVTEITAPRSNLYKWMRSNRKTKIHTLPRADADTVLSLQQGAAIKIVSATADWYRVELPTGTGGYVDSKYLTSKPLQELKTDTILRLLDEPIIHAPAITSVPAGASLSVAGVTDHFYLVEFRDKYGWIEKR